MFQLMGFSGAPTVVLHASDLGVGATSYHLGFCAVGSCRTNHVELHVFL